jgi:tripartite-type tricarboxylate transporter receptor subunit TctC
MRRAGSNGRPRAAEPHGFLDVTQGRAKDRDMPGVARRAILHGALALPWPALATTAPEPVRLVVPFAAGGTNDTVMRVLADGAAAPLGRAIAVENRPGRRGMRVIAGLASAPPDGRLIAQFPAAALRMALLAQLPFEVPRDVTAILGVAGGAYGAIAPTGRFPGGWAGFLQEARDRPGALSYGSGGVNSTGHLTMARLLLREGVRAVHVPFRGAALGVQALAAGDVDLMAGPIRIGSLVESGQAEWLHVWTAARLARWPEAPTLRELGYRLTVTAPFGIVAPPGLPAALRAALHDAFRAAMAAPAFREVLAEHDMTEDYRDGAAYAAFLAEQARAEEMLIGRLGLQP